MEVLLSRLTIINVCSLCKRFINKFGYFSFLVSRTKFGSACISSFSLFIFYLMCIV